MVPLCSKMTEQTIVHNETGEDNNVMVPSCFDFWHEAVDLERESNLMRTKTPLCQSHPNPLTGTFGCLSRGPETLQEARKRKKLFLAS